MTARHKPASARLAIARLAVMAVTIAISGGGIFLATAAVPALADQPASITSAAPMLAAIAPGALVEAAPLGGTSVEPTYETIASGTASYYGRELAGNRTASGERFNPSELTAAHRTLPLGSKVRVTNSRTGDSVIVRINDRGPFHSNRLIDLSEAAARQIGIRATGSGTVQLAVAAD
jgi:rare lipoprotein A